ncbi:hypothetical protein Tco_0633485 [Tanacetum coccineum]
MMDLKVQHEDPSIQTSPLLTIPIFVIPKSSTAPATIITSLLSSLFLNLQQSTPISTPTTTEATTSTNIVPDSETLSAIHQRLSDVENEVKTLRNQPKPQKSVADICKIKIEQAGKHQEPKYTIVSSDVDALPEFDQKRTLFETMTKTKSFEQNSKHKGLYHALIESILEDEDAMDKGVADKLKRRKPDDDRDEGPPAAPDQGLKRKKTGKETEPSKKAKSTGTSKGTTKSQPKSTGKSAQAKETMFDAGDTQVPHDLREDTSNTDEPPVINVDPKDWFKKPERPPTLDPEWNGFISDLTQDIMVGSTYELLKGTCKSYVELDYNMEECYKALTDQLHWSNPEGDRYPFDLSKSLPLVKSRNRQIVPVDYFFDNGLEYLQRESTGKTYTTSLTKTKAAKYNLKGIEDMVPNLWSPIKVAYDKHALLGTSHWGPKRQRFYGYASKMVSKYDVYSTKRILDVTNVKVNIWYGYGHLEEIENRLFNLEGDVIVHFGAALRMFTRRIVIQKRVEDLQLGIESYQKNLNISKPRTCDEDLSQRSPYTTLTNP